MIRNVDCSLVHQCLTSLHVGLDFCRKHRCKVVTCCDCVYLAFFAAPLLTYHHIDVVAATKELLVIISNGVGISPSLGLVVSELGHWLTLLGTCYLGAASSVTTLDVVCIIILPTETKFAANSPTLERLPIQTCIVVLLETNLLLVSCVNSLQWSSVVR